MQLPMVLLMAEPTALSLEELQQYQIALDKHAIMSVADLAGIIIYVNDKFCAISGYSRDELLSKNHNIINSGVHEKDFFKLMWSTILSGDTWSGNICNRRKDGELYWVESSITPILSENGKPQKFISIRTDITAVKNLGIKSLNTSRRLEKQQAVLMSLITDSAIYDYGLTKAYETIMHLSCNTVSATNMGLWLLDKNNECFECVMQFFDETKLYQQGMSIVKQQNTKFFNSIKVSRVLTKENNIEVLLVGGVKTDFSLVVPVWLRAKLLGFISVDLCDYERDWFLDECQFLVNISDFVAQFLDNCKKKELEIKLLTAQRMARLGSWELDIKEKKFYWSDEMYEIYGVEKDVFIPKYDNVYDFVYEQDKDAIKNFELNTMSGLKERIKYQIIRNDGTSRYLHLSGEVYYDEVNEPKKLFGTIIDITEQVSLEKKSDWQQYVFHHIFDQAQNALLLLDSSQKITMVNLKFCALFGYQQDDVIGETLQFLFQDENEYKNHFDVLNKLSLMEYANRFLENEISYKHNSNRIIISNTFSSVIRASGDNGDDSFFNYLENIQDITKYKI